MTTPSFRLLLVAMYALWSTAGQSQETKPGATGVQTFKVDDSGTVVFDPVVSMQWQPSGPARGSQIASATTRVSVQLNLAEWVGSSGRIYMSLPQTSGPIVRATWQTGGTLLGGSMISGQRALVFAGSIASPGMRDLFDIRLEVDGSKLFQPEALAFGFEIEVNP